MGYGSADTGANCVACVAGTSYTTATGTGACSTCATDASKTVNAACTTTSDTTFNNECNLNQLWGFLGARDIANLVFF